MSGALQMRGEVGSDDSIAVFDSGVGGLTVLHELLVHLPHEDFLYFGDTEHFPYGSKTPEQLVGYATKITEYLLTQPVKLIVIACNSATAAALTAVKESVERERPDVGVLHVIKPESELAVAGSATKRVGLLATQATVNSGAYKQVIEQIDSSVELTSVACPELAPIIQSGFPFSTEVVDTVRRYVQPLTEAKVDTVILGCTHYPLVKPMLQRYLGGSVKIVTAGDAVVQRVNQLLFSRGLESNQQGEGRYRFLCSGELESFRKVGGRFLQMPIEDIDRVTLD